MDSHYRLTILINACRAAQDQLRSAIRDRDKALLALATIATSRRLNADELRRMATRSCPYDPWDLRIELEERRVALRGRAEL